MNWSSPVINSAEPGPNCDIPNEKFAEENLGSQHRSVLESSEIMPTFHIIIILMYTYDFHGRMILAVVESIVPCRFRMMDVGAARLLLIEGKCCR